MNKYNCLKKVRYDLGDYFLTGLREEDIQSIRKWRNKQVDILRQKKLLTIEEQIRYYHEVIKEAFSDPTPDLLIFSFLYQDSCIGYGGLVNIDWESRRAEVSFLMETNRTRNDDVYKKEFAIFLKIIMDIAFSELNLNKLYAETYETRLANIEVFEKMRFVLEGKLRKHVLINGVFVDSLIHGCLKESVKN